MQPTTALDVAIQAQILDLVRKLQRENGMSVLLITHDLGVIAEMCDRVAVMYAGRVVEFGSVLDILDRAAHPWTRGLLASRPKISDGVLLVDVGQIFIEDVERAALRLPALEAARAVWLEEPFHASALEAYGALARRCTRVKLAGGEGAHNASMARHLIDYGQIGFVQIDCGRIGGIGPAKQVADYAVARGVTYVNHTFTSHLALSASLQPFAGLRQHKICEYPVALKALAIDLTVNHLTPDAAGEITAPDAPGLGITINAQAVQQYRVEVDIRVNGKTLYLSPAFQS